ncbi:condensation domain-containing protein [Lentzea sp. BCCO 10_0798]|uniref:Condensation domain-containing protein n=1 Tax=Lentzea kristufekii TaxID=3095430 RepID=A0ABU4U560_9PSEU|nr:phosphopantetheine-binding protein [Lentzea sp. BCCO 10_0798]MDX8055703.1 condensation domain-containing protein [Lentzea sp. BCCO 10_0798]
MSEHAQLTEIWAEVLGLDSAEIRDDVTFLSLGGDSLLVVRVAALVRQRLGARLAITRIQPAHTLAELAELVRDHAADGAVAQSPQIRVGRRLDTDAPFDLLPLQQAYFVGQQGAWELSHDSAHYYIDFALSDVDDEFAVEAIEDGLRQLMIHQPVLRARISADGRQNILPADDPSADEPPLRVHDLREASEEEAGAEVERIRDEMGGTGPDPRHGPGFAVRLSLLPKARARVHIALNLALADGWSARIFMRDLLTLAADPNAMLPPMLVDFGDYVDAVRRMRETPEWRRDRDWWWERLDTMPAAPALPLVADPAEVRATGMALRERVFGQSEWTRVKEACARHDVTPSAAFTAVYARVLAKLTGSRRMLLNTLQANRHPLHPDVDRMIGAFSSTVLVPLELPERAKFGDVAKSVAAQLNEALSHNLVSGVEVARELARRRGTRRPIAPVVLQSAVGSMMTMLDEGLQDDYGPLGVLDERDHHNRIRTPQVMLELRAYEAAGDMVLSMASIDELFDGAALDSLFAEVVDGVSGLVREQAWADVVELRGDAQPVQRGEEPRIAVQPGPARGDAELEVAAVWAEILGLSEVDRSANFFELGGDSLMAIRMLRRLGSDRATTPSPGDFLRSPVLADLAALLDGSTP